MGSKRASRAFKDAKHQLLLVLLAKAVEIIERLLSDPRVVTFLGRVADDAIDWARQRLRKTRRLHYRLAEFFGQRALERRIDNLADVIDRVFATAPADMHSMMRRSVDEIRKALDVARAVSFVKRKRMHFAIDDSIDNLERMLAAAVLSASAS